MGLWRRSLAEDNVDRYNHTVSVLFLLLLALATWLLPLGSNIQPNNQPSRLFRPNQARVVDEEQVVKPKLRTMATCWCPSSFGYSMIDHTSLVCSDAYLQVLQGKTAKNGASIRMDAGKTPEFKPNITLPNIVSTITRIRSKEKALSQRFLDFMRIETPYTLFLLAVGLALPSIVCSLLCCLVGGINVHQTLSASLAGARLDYDGRRKIYTELAHAMARATASRTWGAGVVYLLMKALACMAAVVGLIIVSTESLPQARNLERVISSKSGASRGNIIIEGVNMDAAHAMVEEFYESHNDRVFHCEFHVSTVINIHDYIVQCHFTLDINYEALFERHVSETPQSLPNPTSTQAMPLAWEIYVTLYQVVQTHLLVLTVVNLFSLIIWVAKLLLRSCRSKVTSGKGIPSLDIVFLLQMAQENVGPGAVQAFSHALLSGDTKEKEEAVVSL